MTERELLYVKTIAQEKSLSKAATKLFVTQPSLSQCVTRLENRLGTQLFKRTSYGLTLTFAGEKYVHTANNILKIYSDFKNDILEVNSLNKGKITIGLTHVLSGDILPQIIPLFMENYPNIQLELVEENTIELEKRLLTGEVDFAVTHSHPRINFNQKLAEHSLLVKDPFVLICNKDHKILKHAKQNPNGLPIIDLSHCAHEKFIMVQQGQRIRQITDYLLLSQNLTPEILLTTKNCQTAKNLAAAGLGITLLPTKYADSVVTNNPDCQYCTIDHPDAYWLLSVMVQKEGYVSVAANKFIDILKEVCI